MASNKNQHFVPRCYLRPFTVDGADSAINLYNIDRQVFIRNAPVKHQCSGNYFYGKNPRLETAIQTVEGEYATALRQLLERDAPLANHHRTVLRLFWLLQHLRTEAASRRAVEMTDLAQPGIGLTTFRLEIRDAVQMAMMTFAESMRVVSDMKVCLVKNRTNIPFLTSDDPAILTNRWYIETGKLIRFAFGLHSAGDILLLPLSPQILCLGYDGNVYSVSHENGWVEARRDSDVEAFNQHQFLNCRANIFVRNATHAKLVHESFTRVASRRPQKRHRIHFAVADREEGDYTRYRVVDANTAKEHGHALIHVQAIHPIPESWPTQIAWRRKGFVYTNGTGVGYVREPNRPGGPPFRKEATGLR